MKISKALPIKDLFDGPLKNNLFYSKLADIMHRNQKQLNFLIKKTLNSNSELTLKCK